MKRLAGKVALVTGGATGLGRAIAERLSAEGAEVAVSDIDDERGAAFASATGMAFFQHDVASEAQWRDVVASIEERLGRLDILVNNAGILGRMDNVTPEDTPFSEWKRVFTVNVDSVFLGCQHAIPAMRRAGAGAIVNVSSVAGLIATPYATAYGASKATVRQLTKTIAQYCAEQRLNIRCNSVHPNNVRSDMWDGQARRAAASRGVEFSRILAENLESVPLGDFTTKEDVAAAVAFLVSDDARHITGTKLLVDGGFIECDSFHLRQLRRRQEQASS